MDSTAKVAEIEMAEKEKMKEKVERILKHGINCFINRYTHTHTHVLSRSSSIHQGFSSVVCVTDLSNLVISND